MISTLRPLSPTHEPFYFVRSTLIGNDVTLMERSLQEHLAFLKPFYDEGKVPFSGPFQSPDGYLNGDGMYVLRVDSLVEAMQIVEQDPFHKLGIRQFEITIWQRKQF
jgi:uncharacterized protein YciI